MGNKFIDGFKNIQFSKQTFFLIAVAFAFSVFCRMYWVYWASAYEPFFWNDQLMISTNDGYAFAEGARDMMAGFHQPNDLSYYGRSLSSLTYVLASFLPFKFETIILYMSVFFSSLIVVPVILIAREYGMLKVGFVAALLASIANSYYNRTMAGYYDTDMLVIVLAVFVLWSMVRLVESKQRSNLIYIPVFILIYNWWYPSSFSLNSAMIGLFLIYTLIFDRTNKLNYEALIFMIIALTNIDYVPKFSIIIALYAAIYFKPEIWNKKTIAILAACAVALFAACGGLKPIIFQLKFYIFRDVAESTGLTFHYYNVNQTIRESSIVPFDTFAQRISGHVITFIVAFIGTVLMAFKFRSFLLATPMLLLGFLAVKGGLRFTVYAVPVMALGFGYILNLSINSLKDGKHFKKFCIAALAVFIATLCLYFDRFYGAINESLPVFGQNLALVIPVSEVKIGSYLIFALVFAFACGISYLIINSVKSNRILSRLALISITLVALAPCVWHIYGYKVSTVFVQKEVESVSKLEQIAGREDYTLAWWDYGYPIRYYADTKTLIDGGKHLGRDNFAVSFALGEPQRASANMARLEVEYTERKFSEKFGSNLAQMMKEYNFTDVNLFLNSLNDKEFKLPNKTRDIYYYLPDAMMHIFPVALQFSRLDLSSGKKYEDLLFHIGRPYSLSKDRIDIGNGFSISNDATTLSFAGEKIPMNTYYETNYNEKEELVVKKFERDKDGKIYVVYMKDYGRFLVLDKQSLDSTYVQLFVFENYDKELFEPVLLNGAVKIYKLLK
ncbi:STT3 domain-containing protein [Campylobacter sp. RM16188]|uniref:STT3 domain-containing protein n=1 Tax=Campylobacter sp. RM16188 TaxID=1705725 RepID=UPI00155435A8|nr:STT3 domain-containing protein [Campylobacter sp. RM16188]